MFSKRGNYMPVQVPNLTADDQATYRTWLRRICAVYGIAMVLGLALVAFHSSVDTGRAAESMSGAMTLAAD
jgi:hypothetical protein